MPRYKWVGDSPRSIPELSIDRIEPGETVEFEQELNHPDFKPLAERGGRKKGEESTSSDEPKEKSEPAVEKTIEPATEASTSEF